MPDGALTVMLNAGSEAVRRAVLAEMTIFESVPSAFACGSPESAPVEALKLAQLGWFLILNVTFSPLEPLTCGANQYALPAVTAVTGVPLIVSVAAPAVEAEANAVRTSAPSPSALVTFVVLRDMRPPKILMRLHRRQSPGLKLYFSLDGRQARPRGKYRGIAYHATCRPMQTGAIAGRRRATTVSGPKAARARGGVNYGTFMPSQPLVLEVMCRRKRRIGGPGRLRSVSAQGPKKWRTGSNPDAGITAAAFALAHPFG